jgi:hypothetical protein
MQVVISTFTPHFLLHSCNPYFPAQCLDPRTPKSYAPQSERTDRIHLLRLSTSPQTSHTIASVYLHQYAGKSINYPTSPTFTSQPLWDSQPVIVRYARAVFPIAGRFNLLPHQTVRINPGILIFAIFLHLPINGSKLFLKAATTSGA